MNVELLLTRLKKGDQLAYKELVFHFSARLMTIARIYSSSEEDAKDILQDTFILVFRKINQFVGSEEKQLYGCLKRIIINLCLSRNQKKYRTMESSLDNMNFDKGVSADAIGNLTHQEIMDLVFKLPDGYRQVFALFAIEGYSHREIAEKLSIGESSSRSQYSRAKKLLQLQFNNLFNILIA